MTIGPRGRRPAGPCRGDDGAVSTSSKQAPRPHQRSFSLTKRRRRARRPRQPQRSTRAIDRYHFTSRINRSLDEAGRLRIVEMMWEIAYADGQVTEFEDNLCGGRRPALRFVAERIDLRERVAESARSLRINGAAWRAAPVNADHRRLRRDWSRVGSRFRRARGISLCSSRAAKPRWRGSLTRLPLRPRSAERAAAGSQ